MSLFWLKKFVSFWMMPLPFCLTLLVVGAAYLFSPRLQKLGRRLVVMGALLFLLFSNKLVSTWLAQPLEERYSAMPELRVGGPLPGRLAACHYIVVLGGGHGNASGLPATTKLSTSALGRLVEGVRLARLLPGARLIVSGPAEPGYPSHASILRESALSLGIDAGRIVMIDTARDTEDESRAVKAIVGDEPVALVTSAWHMPRAAALFRGAGVEIVACPADYMAKPAGRFQWSSLSWDSESLDRSTMAIRELIGQVWVSIRGKD